MLTREQAESLADLVHLLRPEWDRAGIFTALGRVRQRNELDVAMAAIRAAATPELRTPGAISANGDHWRERISPSVAPRPPKPNEACRDCGRHFDACDCEGGPTIRVAPPTPDPVAAVRRLRDAHRAATADHCSHHLPRQNCIEHRAATEETA